MALDSMPLISIDVRNMAYGDSAESNLWHAVHSVGRFQHPS